MSGGNIDENTSDQTFHALTRVHLLLGSSFSVTDPYRADRDLPLFLGYILSYFLQGILVVQVFAYFLSFKKDRKYMKFAVLFVFILEWGSTIVATVAALRGLVAEGRLADLSTFTLFKVLSPLCGLVVLVVHTFYCCRIYILGAHIAVPIFICTLSLGQFVTVNIAGFESPLGVGVESEENMAVNVSCAAWLTFTAVADLIIAITLVVLLRRASQKVPTMSAKTRVERGMMICVETGLITGLGALLELTFYLAFRMSFIHFVLFYILPKLYSNCMMATLNARLALPGRSFTGSGDWEWAHRVRTLVAIEERTMSTISSLSSGSTRPVSQVSNSDDKERSPKFSRNSDAASEFSECSGNIEAFWSAYTPVNKYSFTWNHVSLPSRPLPLVGGPTEKLSVRNTFPPHPLSNNQ